MPLPVPTQPVVAHVLQTAAPVPVSSGDPIFSSLVSFTSQELNCKQNDSCSSEILLVQEIKL